MRYFRNDFWKIFFRVYFEGSEIWYMKPIFFIAFTLLLCACVPSSTQLAVSTKTAQIPAVTQTIVPTLTSPPAATATLITVTPSPTVTATATKPPPPLPVARTSYENSISDTYVETGNTLGVGYADFNSDGYEDLLMASLSGTTGTTPIRMFLGYYTGEFIGNNSLLPSPIPGTVHARKIAIADFNGDSIPDAFIADHGYDKPPFPGARPVLLLSKNGKFEAPPMTNIPIGFQHSATAADINGDGKPDIFVTDTTNGSFILLNDGNANFTVTRHGVPVIKDGYFTSELIDLDGDGFYDLLVGGHEHDGAITRVYWGDASGTFSDGRMSIIPSDVDYRIVLDFDAADINNDGSLELVVDRTKSQPFYEGFFFQILNLKKRQFTDVSTKITPNRAVWEGSLAPWVTWIMLRDFNGDGSKDIVVPDKARGLVYLNDGLGNFKKAP
jgi:hypothetical protein